MPALLTSGLPVRQRLIALLALTAAMLAVAGTGNHPAWASIGIGVQAAPVRLTQAAHPGGTYELPPVYVVNTGSEPEWIRLTVQRLSRGRALTVPASWIQVQAAAVRLDPQHAQRIPLTLMVPGGARPGSYLSDIVATGSAHLVAGRANLGVAAATELRFTVAPGAVAGSLLPGWLLWAFAGVLAAGLAVFGFRRSGWQIRVERTDRLPRRGTWRRETS